MAPGPEGSVRAAAPRPARPGAERRAGPFAWPLLRVGAKARQLLFHPPDPWPGNAARGRDVLHMDTARFWQDGTGGLGDDPHRFAWMRDLRALGGDEARRHGQALLAAWLLRGFLRRRGVRAPAVAADRLAHWIGQFDFFAKQAPHSLKGPLFRSMAHQARALARAAPRIAATAARLHALRAIAAFGAAVPGAQARLEQAMRIALPLLEGWPEHGLVPERNPSDQLAALRDLVDIRAVLLAAQHEVPPALDLALAGASRALAALRHGDGGLALFHGAVEEDPALVGLTLALAGAEAAPPPRMSFGYERASAADTLLIFDAAAPDPAYRFAHAGTLAFELSAGRQRLVVNCGCAREGDSAWRNAGRMTAAHSTLIVADRNSSRVRAGGGLSRAAGGIAVDRQDDARATWISASHDGYRARFGLIHRRRLFLAADGSDLRGEDRLEPAAAAVSRHVLGTPYCVRFHLHPGVTVGAPERDASGAAVVPLAAGSAGPWQFVSEGAHTVAVEESFYLGQGAPRRTRQIVLAGRVESDDGAQARWAIRRMR